MKTLSQKIISGAAILALILIGARALQNSSAQTEPASPPPDAGATDTSASLPSDILPDSPLAQVIRLAQSGVEEKVILAYVNGSGSAFNLTPDQIIYLKDLGLPDDVVTAMIQRDQQLGATANPTPAPAPATTQTETPVQPVAVTQNYFYDTLSPYGGWVNVDGYGLCWRPTAVVYDSGWQPYCDHGHWIYTDAGWYWFSDYSWGATAFHYGRWFHHARFGWCWYPDTVWAPSWVTWRYGNDYCGWAPLPPHTVFRPGVGIVFNGAAVGASFDFGLGVNLFTFVPTRNFSDPHLRRSRVAPGEAAKIFNRTTVIHNFAVNGRDHSFVNNGIPPERISAVTRKEIRRVSIHDSAASIPHGQQITRDTLIVNRPRIQENAVSTLNQGIKPPVIRQNTPRPLIVNKNGNNSAPPAKNPRQDDFSQPNHVAPPARDQNGGQPQIPRTQTPTTPANHYVPPAQTPNYNYDNRVMSPRQQQIQKPSPRFNSPDSVQREIPAAPVQPRDEAQPSPRNDAPVAPEPAAPQKSGRSDQDKDRPGH